MLTIVFSGFALLKWGFADGLRGWESPLLAGTVMVVIVGQLVETPRWAVASLCVGGVVGFVCALRLVTHSADAHIGWSNAGLFLLLGAALIVGFFDVARQYGTTRRTIGSRARAGFSPHRSVARPSTRGE